MRSSAESATHRSCRERRDRRAQQARRWAAGNSQGAPGVALPGATTDSGEPMSLRTRFCAALPLAQLIDTVDANAPLWRSFVRRATITADALERVHAVGGRVAPPRHRGGLVWRRRPYAPRGARARGGAGTFRCRQALSPDMHRRPLAAVLFASLFTFQLLLAGASGACPMGEHGSMFGAQQQVSGPSGAAGMTRDLAMMMPGMPAAEGGALPAGDAPCGEPMPADECRTMALCTASYAAPVEAMGGQSEPDRALAVVARVLPPLSAFAPPEPPPPRV